MHRTLEVIFFIPQLTTNFTCPGWRAIWRFPERDNFEDNDYCLISQLHAEVEKLHFLLNKREAELNTGFAIYVYGIVNTVLLTDI